MAISADVFSILGESQLAKRAGQIGMSDLIRSGLPPQIAFSLQRVAGISNDALAKIAGASYRTLQRHSNNRGNLSPVVSDRLVGFLHVLSEASRTLGTLEDGVDWMKCRCRPLGNQRPIDVVDTFAGISEVTDILGRIRHGLFS